MATSALEVIADRSRRRIAEDGVSPDDAVAVEAVVRQVVEQYQHLAGVGQVQALADVDRTVERVVSNISGLGVLESLLGDPEIEDILIEGDVVRFFKAGHLRALREPTTEDELRHIIDQLLSRTGVTLDKAHPIVDGVQVLNGQARLSCAIPPASPHLRAAIRLYVKRYSHVRDLVANETLPVPAAHLLSTVVRSKGSILISGETGSGKSTLLAALLAEAHPNHNVQLLEESQELQFHPAFGGRLQCVPGGMNGDGESGAGTLRELVKVSLRWKPDIIVVGEVRAEESWELARASRVGAGFLATIHANSAEDALEALVLTALGAGENISEVLIRRTFGRSLDLVVHCERDDPNLLAEGEGYRHQVTEIRAVTPQLGTDAFSSELIFERKGGLGTPLVWTGKQPPTALVNRLQRLLPNGQKVTDVLTGSV